jgi:hypothetical protein
MQDAGRCAGCYPVRGIRMHERAYNFIRASAYFRIGRGARIVL